MPFIVYNAQLCPALHDTMNLMIIWQKYHQLMLYDTKLLLSSYHSQYWCTSVSVHHLSDCNVAINLDIPVARHTSSSPHNNVLIFFSKSITNLYTLHFLAP